MRHRPATSTTFGGELGHVERLVEDARRARRAALAMFGAGAVFVVVLALVHEPRVRAAERVAADDVKTTLAMWKPDASMGPHDDVIIQELADKLGDARQRSWEWIDAPPRGAHDPTRTVSLQVDEHARFRDVWRVMNTIRASGYENVRLATSGSPR